MATQKRSKAHTTLSVVSLLFFIAGLVYVALIPVRPLVAQGVYIDENALLPHQGAPPSVSIAEVDATDAAVLACVRSGAALSTCVADLMTQLGLDTATARFTRSGASAFASEEWTASASAVFGDAAVSDGAATVVAGHWRAPRTDGTHTLALAVETPFWFTLNGPLSNGGVPSALATALASIRAAAGQSFLAKDVIVLAVINPAHAALAANLTATQNTTRGTFPYTRLLAAGRALAVDALARWADAYTGVTGSQATAAGPATVHVPRAGALMAVLALDAPGLYPAPGCVSELSVSAQGPGGLLPNLDIVTSTLSAFPGRTLIAEPPLRAAAQHTYAPLNARFTSTSSARFFPVSSSVAAAEDSFWTLWSSAWALAGRPSTTEHGLGTARFAAQQALGAVSTLHAPWIARSIDAVTVGTVFPGVTASVAVEETLAAAAQGRAPVAAACGARPLVRVLVTGTVEWLRMFSNAHEKLHHSTFLYLLSSAANFTTMAKYVYSFAALAAPLALWALYAAFAASTARLLQAAAAAGAVASLAIALFLVLPSALLSVGLWPTPLPGFADGTDTRALAVVVALSVVFAVVVIALVRGAARAVATAARAGSAVSTAEAPWETTHALLGGAMFLPLPPFVIMNFSATLTVTALVSALALAVRPSVSRARALAQLLPLALLSPPAVVFIATLLLRPFAADPAFAGTCLWPAAEAAPTLAAHAQATVQTLQCAAAALPRATDSPLALMAAGMYLPFWLVSAAFTVASLCCSRRVGHTVVVTETVKSMKD